MGRKSLSLLILPMLLMDLLIGCEPFVDIGSLMATLLTTDSSVQMAS